MGLIHHGVPRDLIGELARVFDLRYFVETGTYHGGSGLWAPSRFEKVWTVKIDEALFRTAQRRLAGRKNVEQHLGDSTKLLTALAEPFASLRGAIVCSIRWIR
jgi:predicted O-methyltransferase YrrM